MNTIAHRIIIRAMMFHPYLRTLTPEHRALWQCFIDSLEQQGFDVSQLVAKDPQREIA